MTTRITMKTASGSVSMDVDLNAATDREERRLLDTASRAEVKMQQTGDGTLIWDEQPAAHDDAEEQRGLIAVEDAIALVALWAGEA